MRSGVIPAAIERPIVDPDAPADDAGSEVAVSASERDIGFAFAQVAKVLAIVELDHDLGVTLVKLAKHGSEQADGEDFLSGDSNLACRVPGDGRGGF